MARTKRVGPLRYRPLRDGMTNSVALPSHSHVKDLTLRPIPPSPSATGTPLRGAPPAVPGVASGGGVGAGCLSIDPRLSPTKAVVAAVREWAEGSPPTGGTLVTRKKRRQPQVEQHASRPRGGGGGGKEGDKGADNMRGGGDLHPGQRRRRQHSVAVDEDGGRCSACGAAGKKTVPHDVLAGAPVCLGCFYSLYVLLSRGEQSQDRGLSGVGGGGSGGDAERAVVRGDEPPQLFCRWCGTAPTVLAPASATDGGRGARPSRSDSHGGGGADDNGHDDPPPHSTTSVLLCANSERWGGCHAAEEEMEEMEEAVGGEGATGGARAKAAEVAEVAGVGGGGCVASRGGSYGYCQECIVRNLGRQRWHEALAQHERGQWTCPACTTSAASPMLLPKLGARVAVCFQGEGRPSVGTIVAFEEGGRFYVDMERRRRRGGGGGGALPSSSSGAAAAASSCVDPLRLDSCWCVDPFAGHMFEVLPSGGAAKRDGKLQGKRAGEAARGGAGTQPRPTPPTAAQVSRSSPSSSAAAAALSAGDARRQRPASRSRSGTSRGGGRRGRGRGRGRRGLHPEGSASSKLPMAAPHVRVRYQDEEHVVPLPSGAAAAAAAAADGAGAETLLEALGAKLEQRLKRLLQVVPGHRCILRDLTPPPSAAPASAKQAYGADGAAPAVSWVRAAARGLANTGGGGGGRAGGGCLFELHIDHSRRGAKRHRAAGDGAAVPSS
jgi:hypothetical protein